MGTLLAPQLSPIARRQRAVWMPPSILLQYRADAEYLTYGASPPQVSRWDPILDLTPGYLSQATAVFQPDWIAPALRHNANDFFLHSAGPGAHNLLHDGTGSTLFILFRITTVAAFNALWGTVFSGAQVGAMSFVSGSALWYRVQDGLGAQLNVSGGTVVADEIYVTTYRLSASAYDVWVNYSSVVSGVPVGISAADHTHALTIGVWGGGGAAALNGDLFDVLLCDSWLSDADVENTITLLLGRVP